MAMHMRVDRDDSGNVEVSPCKQRKLRPLDDEEESSSPKPKSAMKAKSALKGSTPSSNETPTPPVEGTTPTKSAMKPKSAMKGGQPPPPPPEEQPTPAIKSGMKKSAMKGGPESPASGFTPKPPPGPSPKSAMKGGRGPPPPSDDPQEAPKTSMSNNRGNNASSKSQSDGDSMSMKKMMSEPRKHARPSVYKMSLELEDPTTWCAKGLCRHYFYFAGQKTLWEEQEHCHKARKTIKLADVAAMNQATSAHQASQYGTNTSSSSNRGAGKQSLQRSQSLIIVADDLPPIEQDKDAPESFEISPLKELMLEKKPDVNKIRAVLMGLSIQERAKWIDTTLDATPPPMPPPLFHAVAAVHANIVELLVEFNVDVKAEYQGKSMLKGWIKPMTSLVECVRGRKARFLGTMLGDKLEAIEGMLTEAATGGKTDAEDDDDGPDAHMPPPQPSDKSSKSRKSIQMKCSRGLMLHTQGHPNLKYELVSGFNGVGITSVREAKDTETGEGFAVKAGSKMHDSGGKDPEAELWNEITVMRKVDHPNIIKLYETFEDETHIFMVFELCVGGELFDRLVHEGSFPEKIVMRLAYQMASAIRHLHQLRVAHRDIQPESFLVASDAPLAETGVKLVDFSTAKEVHSDNPLTTKMCTLHYVAPEVITSSNGYNEKVDIWSFGVLIFVMAAGVPPFDAEKELDIFKAIKAGAYSFNPENIWATFSEDVKDVIKKTIVVDPEQRLDISRVMDCPMMLRAETDGAVYQAPRGNTLSGKGDDSKKLIRTAFSMMAERISDDQVQEVRNLFKELDQGGTGMVEITDCREGIKKMVSGKGNSEELIAVLSSDSLAGKVNYSMFLATMIDRRREIRREAARAVFNTFDIDKNGNISLYEIAQAFGKEKDFNILDKGSPLVSAVEVKAIWEEMKEIFSDTDLEDKEMSFDEFFKQLPKANLEIGF